MLTAKKRLYAEARLSGRNIKDSAIAAGYSESTARQSGSRLERDEDVRSYLERLGFSPTVPAKKEKPKEPAKKSGPSETQAAKSIADRATIPMDNYDDPIEYMKAVVNAQMEDPKLRLDAAKAWDAAIRGRAQAKGKKEEQAERAKEIVSKFAIPTPPSLRAVK